MCHNVDGDGAVVLDHRHQRLIGGVQSEAVEAVDVVALVAAHATVQAGLVVLLKTNPWLI